MAYRFEWNERKANSNRIRHGVTFDEAATVLDDALARIFDNGLNSGDERREIIIGHSITRRLLLVCFTERPDETIRIIGARPPTAKERKAYEENI